MGRLLAKRDVSWSVSRKIKVANSLDVWASKGNLSKARKFFSRTRQEADSEESIKQVHALSK